MLQWLITGSEQRDGGGGQEEVPHLPDHPEGDHGPGDASQVTVDPITLAPTDILDPRALAWVASLGAGHRHTLKVNLPLL